MRKIISPSAEPISGFYLGYLWGRSFPPRKKKCPASPPQKGSASHPPPPPPKKILLSLQYISKYIGKIIQTRRGQCTHCNISQNCVSKCTRLHLNSYSFKKISGEKAPDPPRKLVAFGHSGLLPTNDKSQTEPRQ